MHERLLNVLRDEFATSPPASSANYADSSMPISPVNFKIVLCFAAFVFPYVAFLLILPGIREKRLISFIAITTQLCIGILLMASLILPYWKVGEARIVSHFRFNSNQRHEAEIGVNLGLESLNITLKYIRTVESGEIPHRGLYFNERYDLNGVNSMARELQSAYKQGLPYPILRVLEYFSLTQGAFAWGRQYRNAGHFASALLWFAFIIWLFQCLILALVPWHFSKLGILCGLFALFSDLVYVILSPHFDLVVPFAGVDGQTSYLRLNCGICFYMSLIAGAISIMFSVVLAILQFFRLYTISTCFSTRLDDTVGLKCQWPGRRNTPFLDWNLEDSSSASSSTSVENSSTCYTVNELSSVQTQSLNSSGTASSIFAESVESTPTSPKKRVTAIGPVLLNAIALANAMCSAENAKSAENVKSVEILRRRTRDKSQPPLNPLHISQLCSAIMDGDSAGNSSSTSSQVATPEMKKQIDHESSGFQSRSSLSGRNSTSSLESIQLHECRMTDDEEDAPITVIRA